MGPAKTAEPIEMPFGRWTPVGPKKPVIDGVFCAVSIPLKLLKTIN